MEDRDVVVVVVVVVVEGRVGLGLVEVREEDVEELEERDELED